GEMSRMRVVPAAVPSLMYGSRPSVPSLAARNSPEPSPTGATETTPLRRPGATSVARCVPAAVPSLTHSSAPWSAPARSHAKPVAAVMPYAHCTGSCSCVVPATVPSVVTSDTGAAMNDAAERKNARPCATATEGWPDGSGSVGLIEPRFTVPAIEPSVAQMPENGLLLLTTSTRSPSAALVEKPGIGKGNVPEAVPSLRHTPPLPLMKAGYTNTPALVRSGAPTAPMSSTRAAAVPSLIHNAVPSQKNSPWSLTRRP